MNNLFIFLAVLFFIFRGLAKLLEGTAKGQPREEESSSAEKVEDYFETLGPPPVQYREPVLPRPPTIQRPEQIREKAMKKEEPSIQKVPLQEEYYSILPRPLSSRTVREGILLSVILGPPRAKQPLTTRWPRQHW